MDFNLLYLGVVLSVVVSTGLGFNVTRFKFWIRKGTKLRPENVMRNLSLSSGNLFCAEECSRDKTCMSASWNKDGTGCLLSTADQIDDVTYDENRNFISDKVLADALWKTASKIRIPVFLVGSPGTRYTFTYSQAKDACKAMGGDMASASDLIFARSLGYNVCVCGWMTEGWIGLVQQTPHICMGYAYNTEIIPCGWLSKADGCIL